MAHPGKVWSAQPPTSSVRENCRESCASPRRFPELAYMFNSDASTSFDEPNGGPTGGFERESMDARQKKTRNGGLTVWIHWRPGSESNRRTRLCRPLHDHSATRPVAGNMRLRASDKTRPRRTGVWTRIWSGKRDSNSRPRPWQGRALPTELFPLGSRALCRFRDACQTTLHGFGRKFGTIRPATQADALLLMAALSRVREELATPRARRRNPTR